MHALLLGNGLNRLSLAINWTELLDRLAAAFEVSHLIQYMEQKPLSMLFEELCAQCGGKTVRGTELAVKKKIAALVGEVQINELHRQYTDIFNVILTTNYDDTLERAISGPMFERASVMHESRYSLFRLIRAGGKEVWHIHGDSVLPDTIVLGYDHYAGYLQKIRNYLTDGLRDRKTRELIRSPLKAGVQEFERWQWKYSWTDHFLRDHLHIVGFGFDFTEIDLWWLLVHKRRRKNITGHTFFYQVTVKGQPNSPKPQLSVLRSLGVEVQEVSAPTYYEGYASVLDLVSANVLKYPTLLEVPRSSLSPDQFDADVVSIPEPLPDLQLNLPIKRMRRSNK